MSETPNVSSERHDLENIEAKTAGNAALAASKPQNFPLLKSADLCPDAAKRHTKAPTGYIAWHEWAEKKSKTHKQERCPTCGFFSIWKKR